MLPHSEKFQIYSRHEIAGMLRSMQEQGNRLRMRFVDSPEMVITGVLDVDLKSGRVFLDCAAFPEQNRIVLQSRGISFETVVNRIRVTFRINRIRQAWFDGSPVFVMDLPELMMCHRRRVYPRIPVEGAFIRIPKGEGKDERMVTGVVCDVSLGGITVMDEALEMDGGMDGFHAGCQLFLPDMPSIRVNIRFRNVMEVMEHNCLRGRRIGCRFVDLADEDAARIRRFVTDAEWQMRMRTGCEDA